MLGKGRFSLDVPLCYHEISLQFIQLYVYYTCRYKFMSILMCVCMYKVAPYFELFLHFISNVCCGLFLICHEYSQQTVSGID